LRRVGGVTWREHFAAFVDAHRPIRESIRRIEWSDDQSGTNDRIDSRIVLLDFFLGKSLERAVVLSLMRGDQRVWINVRRHRRGRGILVRPILLLSE
jgi:hypothetical protein